MHASTYTLWQPYQWAGYSARGSAQLHILGLQTHFGLTCSWPHSSTPLQHTHGGHRPWGEWPFPLCLNPLRTLLDTLQQRSRHTLFLANVGCSAIGFCWLETLSEVYNLQPVHCAHIWEQHACMESNLSYLPGPLRGSRQHRGCIERHLPWQGFSDGKAK